MGAVLRKVAVFYMCNNIFNVTVKNVAKNIQSMRADMCVCPKP